MWLLYSSNIHATYPFRMPLFHCSNNYSTCPCSTSLCSTCHKNPVKNGLEKQWLTMGVGFNKNFASVLCCNLDDGRPAEHKTKWQYSKVLPAPRSHTRIFRWVREIRSTNSASMFSLSESYLQMYFFLKTSKLENYAYLEMTQPRKMNVVSASF